MRANSTVDGGAGSGSPPSTPPSANKPSKPSWYPWALYAGIPGLVVLLIALACCIYCVRRYRRQQRIARIWQQHINGSLDPVYGGDRRMLTSGAQPSPARSLARRPAHRGSVPGRLSGRTRRVGAVDRLTSAVNMRAGVRVSRERVQQGRRTRALTPLTSAKAATVGLYICCAVFGWRASEERWCGAFGLCHYSISVASRWITS